MAFNNSDISAVKGNSIRGSLLIYPKGVFQGSYSVDMDFQALGWVRAGKIDSEDGVTSSVSYDSNDIIAWGNDIVDSDFSNGKEIVTLNSISFFDLDILRFIKGELNVVSGTSGDGVPTTTVYEEVGRTQKALSIAVLGEGRYGRRVLKVIPNGVADPNDEYTFNDTDVVKRALAVNCNTATVNGKRVSSLLTFDNITSGS